MNAHVSKTFTSCIYQFHQNKTSSQQLCLSPSLVIKIVQLSETLNRLYTLVLLMHRYISVAACYKKIKFCSLLSPLPLTTCVTSCKAHDLLALNVLTGKTRGVN